MYRFKSTQHQPARRVTSGSQRTNELLPYLIVLDSCNQIPKDDRLWLRSQLKAYNPDILSMLKNHKKPHSEYNDLHVLQVGLRKYVVAVKTQEREAELAKFKETIGITQLQAIPMRVPKTKTCVDLIEASPLSEAQPNIRVNNQRQKEFSTTSELKHSENYRANNSFKATLNESKGGKAINRIKYDPHIIVEQTERTDYGHDTQHIGHQSSFKGKAQMSNKGYQSKNGAYHDKISGSFSGQSNNKQDISQETQHKIDELFRVEPLRNVLPFDPSQNGVFLTSEESIKHRNSFNQSENSQNHYLSESSKLNTMEESRIPNEMTISFKRNDYEAQSRLSSYLSNQHYHQKLPLLDQAQYAPLTISHQVSPAGVDHSHFISNQFIGKPLMNENTFQSFKSSQIDSVSHLGVQFSHLHNQSSHFHNQSSHQTFMKQSSSVQLVQNSFSQFSKDKISTGSEFMLGSLPPIKTTDDGVFTSPELLEECRRFMQLQPSSSGPLPQLFMPGERTFFANPFELKDHSNSVLGGKTQVTHKWTFQELMANMDCFQLADTIRKHYGRDRLTKSEFMNCAEQLYGINCANQLADLVPFGTDYSLRIAEALEAVEKLLLKERGFTAIQAETDVRSVYLLLDISQKGYIEQADLECLLDQLREAQIDSYNEIQQNLYAVYDSALHCGHVTFWQLYLVNDDSAFSRLTELLSDFEFEIEQ